MLQSHASLFIVQQVINNPTRCAPTSYKRRMSTKVLCLYVIASSLQCAIQSLPNGTPGTPVLSQNHSKCPGT